MLAELYALTHRGNPGDTAFYLEQCRGARSVLELGAGAGRLLDALVEPKRRVVGLELDPELLELSQRKLGKRRGVQLVRGDMRQFELGERFERVLLPYNALYCLTSKRDALACFRAARRALEPGGSFVLDVWNAAPFHRAAPSPEDSDAEYVVSVQQARRTYDVFEQTRVTRARQRLDVSYTYLPRTSGASYQIPIAQRYYLRPEVDDLLARAGLRVTARYGDFSRSQFRAQKSAQLIVVAKPAA